MVNRPAFGGFRESSFDSFCGFSCGSWVIKAGSLQRSFAGLGLDTSLPSGAFNTVVLPVDIACMERTLVIQLPTAPITIALAGKQSTTQPYHIPPSIILNNSQELLGLEGSNLQHNLTTSTVRGHGGQ
jgi:hypothetical protein